MYIILASILCLGGGKIIVYISRTVEFLHLGGTVESEVQKGKRISIGFGNSSRKTVWDNHGTILFEGNAHIGAGCTISNKKILCFGKDFAMHKNSDIIAYENITFGKNCLVSWECLIMDTDFHKIVQADICINPNEEIKIGDNVWLGCRCTVLKGASIPEGNVVGAGSIITKKLANKKSVYVGNKKIYDNIEWEY
jgi:acetyltransferase-like isoleucine patch superfamily enzyme